MPPELEGRAEETQQKDPPSGLESVCGVRHRMASVTTDPSRAAVCVGQIHQPRYRCCFFFLPSHLLHVDPPRIPFDTVQDTPAGVAQEDGRTAVVFSALFLVVLG